MCRKTRASSAVRSSAAAITELRQAPQRAFVPVGATLIAASVLVAGCGQGHDLSTEQLSRVVEANRPALKVCYDAALDKFPSKQEMRFDAILHIAPDGRVTKVEMPEGAGLPGMQDCLRAEIMHWRFPQAQAETATSLPLVFKPEVVKTQPSVDTLKDMLQKQQQGGGQ